MNKQQIESLQQSINQLQKQLDDLRNTQSAKLEIATSKVAMWKPEDAEIYFKVLSSGELISDTYVAPIDRKLQKEGNCFPTRELAEHYAKKRAARQRLEMLALAENGMVPYEFKRKQDDACNYYIGWYEGGPDVRVMDFSVINPGVQYFPTRSATQRVLDAMTYDDLVTLFGTANRGDK